MEIFLFLVSSCSLSSFLTHFKRRYYTGRRYIFLSKTINERKLTTTMWRRAFMTDVIDIFACYKQMDDRLPSCKFSPDSLSQKMSTYHYNEITTSVLTFLIKRVGINFRRKTLTIFFIFTQRRYFSKRRLVLIFVSLRRLLSK